MPDLIDKMKHEMDKYISDISQKAGELADTAAVKIEIYNLNKKKESALLHIGTYVYHMFLKERFDYEKINEECREVTAIDELIRLKEKDINHNHHADRKSNKKYRRKKKRVNEEKGVIEAEHYLVKYDD